MTPESDMYDVYPESWTHIITLTFGGRFYCTFLRKVLSEKEQPIPDCLDSYVL